MRPPSIVVADRPADEVAVGVLDREVLLLRLDVDEHDLADRNRGLVVGLLGAAVAVTHRKPRDAAARAQLGHLGGDVGISVSTGSAAMGRASSSNTSALARVHAIFITTSFSFGDDHILENKVRLKLIRCDRRNLGSESGAIADDCILGAPFLPPCGGRRISKQCKKRCAYDHKDRYDYRITREAGEVDHQYQSVQGGRNCKHKGAAGRVH